MAEVEEVLPASSGGRSITEADLDDPPEPRVSDWLRLAVPVLVVAVLVAVGWRLGYFKLDEPQRLGAATDRVQGERWLVPAFLVVYATLAALAAPVSPLAYAAGALFGVARGSLYVWVSSLAGAAAGYYLARTIWSGPARRLLGRFHEKVRQLRERNAFLTALRIQLLPILAFGVFNYAAGVGRLGFAGFIAGTALGIVPGTIASVYVGDRIAAGLRGSGRSAFLVAAVVMAALFGLSFAPKLFEKWRRRQGHDRGA